GGGGGARGARGGRRGGPERAGERRPRGSPRPPEPVRAAPQGAGRPRGGARRQQRHLLRLPGDPHAPALQRGAPVEPDPGLRELRPLPLLPAVDPSVRAVARRGTSRATASAESARSSILSRVVTLSIAFFDSSAPEGAGWSPAPCGPEESPGTVGQGAG